MKLSGLSFIPRPVSDVAATEGRLSDQGALRQQVLLRDLVTGHTREAAVSGETLLRSGLPLTLAQRWQTLADLIECYSASGNLAAAENAYDRHHPGEPDTVRSAAAAARGRGLIAPAIEMRSAFAEALAVAADLPMSYRGRVLMAMARRLGQLGSPEEAGELHAEAIAIFAHLRMSGWVEHARRMDLSLAEGHTMTNRVYDRLNTSELAIVKLLLLGRKNKEAADELFISLRSLEKALTQIYRKIDVSTKAQMVALFRDRHRG